MATPPKAIRVAVVFYQDKANFSDVLGRGDGGLVCHHVCLYSVDLRSHSRRRLQFFLEKSFLNKYENENTKARGSCFLL